MQVRRVSIKTPGVRVPRRYPILPSATRTDYRHPDDIAAITCFFNPHGYRTLRDNYDVFYKAWTDGTDVPLFTVEVLFGESRPTISNANTFHVRVRDRFFHKEGALNYAARNLPGGFSKVIWVDCDLVWFHYHWLATASAALDEYTSVQCGTRIHMRNARGRIERVRNSWLDDPLTGFPGFAWAARREFFDRHGLHQYHIVGGGDQCAVQAFGGPYARHRLSGWMRATGPKYAAHVNDWIDRVAPDMEGKTAGIDVALAHLWHGSRENRQYWNRNKILQSIDPQHDLSLDQNGMTAWTRLSHPAIPLVARYFEGRKEDDGRKRRNITVASKC
jgi:hypothetical protein